MLDNLTQEGDDSLCALLSVSGGEDSDCGCLRQEASHPQVCWESHLSSPRFIIHHDHFEDFCATFQLHIYVEYPQPCLSQADLWHLQPSHAASGAQLTDTIVEFFIKCQVSSTRTDTEGLMYWSSSSSARYHRHVLILNG